MTIPTRPAPPPPQANSNRISSSSINYSASSSAVNKISHKKPAPPRPPPPKLPMSAPALKKSSSQKSISILSNLFGKTKISSETSGHIAHTSSEQRLPPKIPGPPSSHAVNLVRHQSTPQVTSDVQLINFEESPTWSPPTIKKSNTGSDSVSMDSFCSSNSSPNNFSSQAESGFEDDFSVSDFKVTSGSTTRSTTFSSDPFDCLDDFRAPTKSNNLPPSNIRNVKPLIQPKPNIGASSFYTCTSSIVPLEASKEFDDSLSNGKTLVKPASVTMPTIIKPISSKGKAPSLPTHVLTSREIIDTRKTAPVLTQQVSEESFDGDLPSLPMPSIPPPPLPSLEILEGDGDEEKSSYGVALYDFDSDVAEDLNLRANDKVYLIKRMNDEWMYGRNKRGCEGIFPISYVDIRVPLEQVEFDSGARSVSVSPAVEGHHVRALYNFQAETSEDLTIKENEIVNVIYEINSEWLYGSNSSGDIGQFPSMFLEYVPDNLPQMPN